MKILLISNYHQGFHAGYFYLVHELARYEKVLAYSNFATRRRLLPIDFEMQLLKRFNYKLGKGWHVISKKVGAQKRIRDITSLSKDCDVAVVALNSFFGQLNFRDASFIKCPKVLLIADLHFAPHRNMRCIEKSNFDLVLFVYKWWMEWWQKHHPTQSVGWLPHSVETRIFKEYNQPKTYDVVCSGESSDAYPLRALLTETYLQSNLRFSRHSHPRMELNRDTLGSNITNKCVRENYARFLNASLLFAFCSSIYNYPLAKYFEGMAAETLCLAPTPRDAADLHFKSGENFVEISETDFLQKTRYYLSNDLERLQIIKNARSLVEREHSTIIRTQQFRKFLHEL